MKFKSTSATGVILEPEMRQRSAKIFQFFIFAVFIFIAAIFLLPLLWIFLSAFKTTEEFVSRTPTLFPKEIDLGKVWAVWQKGNLGKTYLNTVIMTAGNIMATLMVNGLAGYALSRLKPKGTRLVMALVLWSMMMPSNLSMVPLFINFTKGFLGIPIMNTFIPMWMMSAANAFNTLLFKNFFDGIPSSLMEAARIDGASELTIFTKIVMPMSKPVMMTVSIFSFTGSWGSFLWPNLVLNSENAVLGMKLLTQKEVMLVDEYFMLLLMSVIPPMLFFIFFQKYIMKGYTAGAVKG